MTESLLDTFLRLSANMKEARDRFNKEPTEANNTLLKLHVSVYQDFCCIFTEKMMRTTAQMMDEVKYM